MVIEENWGYLWSQCRCFIKALMGEVMMKGTATYQAPPMCLSHTRHFMDIMSSPHFSASRWGNTQTISAMSRFLKTSQRHITSQERELWCVKARYLNSVDPTENQAVQQVECSKRSWACLVYSTRTARGLEPTLEMEFNCLLVLSTTCFSRLDFLQLFITDPKI